MKLPVTVNSCNNGEPQKSRRESRADIDRQGQVNLSGRVSVTVRDVPRIAMANLPCDSHPTLCDCRPSAQIERSTLEFNNLFLWKGWKNLWTLVSIPLQPLVNRSCNLPMWEFRAASGLCIRCTGLTKGTRE